MTIGRLERVPLREVWKHEEYDFTTWLRDNIDVLNDIIDVTITNVEREQAAGSFSVDLLGEDDEGNAVVIENQLEKSNHDHLGKLITYLTAFEAKTAIWIVSEPRPEHAAAVAWLNQSTSASFYLLIVEAVKVRSDSGISDPAPILTLIVGPSEEGREVGALKHRAAERSNEYQSFWRGLATLAPSVAGVRLRPGTAKYLIARTYQTCWFAFVFVDDSPYVELHFGSRTAEANQRMFDAVAAQRQSIEDEVGAGLQWNREYLKRFCKILLPIQGFTFHDRERWPDLQQRMVDAMTRFDNALAPLIEMLQEPHDADD